MQKQRIFKFPGYIDALIKNKIEHFFILSGDNNFTNLNFGETVNPEGSYTGTTWREEKPANVKSTTFTF